MRAIRWGVLAMVAFAAAGVSGRAVAGPNCGSPPGIRLQQLRGTNGSSVAERNDVIGSDGVACYRVFVTGPGILSINLYSPHDSSTFRVYGTDWKINRAASGFDFSGATLPGAGITDNARVWKGPAQQGNVLVVITKHGDSRRYRLRVQLQ